jgi:hypothetical protein
VPLTGPSALVAEAPDRLSAWICAFLDALADEARDFHQLLIDLEREWLSARERVAGRRSNSRAAGAIDVLAAAPLLSATTLAGAIGMSIKSATTLLDAFVSDGIAVEVTHRSKRRLFGLSGFAPMRDGTAAPRRPIPGRGRGRPPSAAHEEEETAPPPFLPPLTPMDRKKIDYGELEHWIAHAEQVVRSTKQALDTVVRGQVTPRK